MTPEQRARVRIDALLVAAGWQIQDRGDLDLPVALNCQPTIHAAFATFFSNSPKACIRGGVLL